jgi:hypothetical protein
MIWDPKRLRDRTEHPDPPRSERTEPAETVEQAVVRLLDAMRRSELPKRSEATEPAETLEQAVVRLRDALRRETLPAETLEQVMKRLRDALRRPKT